MEIVMKIREKLTGASNEMKQRMNEHDRIAKMMKTFTEIGGRRSLTPMENELGKALLQESRLMTQLRNKAHQEYIMASMEELCDQTY